MAEYISSDTNVWIDFYTIGAVHLPFKLSCTYLMWDVAIADEVRSPEGLREELVSDGLVPAKISEDEFWLADSYTDRYAGISVYDAAALAIAKSRGIALMTGDRRLRHAAADEGVEVTGTIGVLDRLRDEGIVGLKEYRAHIAALLAANGGVVRLPKNELLKRLGGEDDSQ